MMRKGQVAVYLVMVLVALTILAVMNVDLFLSVRSKFRVQNAGDAAALSAARHQGHLLNEIGRLNLEHVYAAIKDEPERIAEIERSQRRIALLGPLEAVKISNDVALKNGAEIREEFSEFLHDHARFVREVYASGDNDADDPYPESWPGAWEEYADAIDLAANEKLAVGVDNIDFHSSVSSHLLTTRRFYDAIRGRDWCWFFFNCHSTLEGYGSFHDWAPLPKKSSCAFANSEIYPLYIDFHRGSLLEEYTVKEITDLMNDFGYKVTEKQVGSSSYLRDPRAVWVYLDRLMWGVWDDMKDFPIVGNVKAEFFYHGAAAICRVYKSDNVWSGAAKPMAALDTSRYNLVRPNFDAVRLVPLDSVGGDDLATADIPWVRHVREHLEPYLERGPVLSPSSCAYCSDLKLWEHRSFRHSGIFWLRFNSESCTRPAPFGFECAGHGGTAHGH